MFLTFDQQILNSEEKYIQFMQFVFGLVWFDLTELILRSLYLGQPVPLEPTMSPLLNVRIAARHSTSGSGSSRHFLQI